MPTRRIDCDVHCAVPSLDALRPYISDYWREYLKMTEFRQPPGVGYSYPAWSTSVATVGSELTLDSLREQVLDHVDLAILHCYYGVESMTHPYQAPELATAVNHWLADEWLDRDDRLRGSLVVTPQFPQAAIAEIERTADDGRFVQLWLPARAQVPYGDPRYWPIWDAAADRGLALCIGYGGGVGNAPSPAGWMDSFYEEYAIAPVGFQSHIPSLIASGVFARRPKMRVVIAESGWTWLPSLMWRMDKEWKTAQREVPWVVDPPSTYVRRHFRATIAPTDAPVGHVRDVYDQLLSDDVLMYASDHPHHAGGDASALLEQLRPEQVERVLWENAVECYGLNVAVTDA